MDIHTLKHKVTIFIDNGGTARAFGAIAAAWKRFRDRVSCAKTGYPLAAAHTKS
jgi:hypothetical protein